MKKKLLLATAIIAPSLAIGGLWIYQANVFEKSITQQLTSAQESLKDYDVSFRYDALHVSKYLFTAHLINPTISGTMPKLSESLKDIEGMEMIAAMEGLKGTVLIKGEIKACFSPVTNSVSIKADGETQLNFDGQIEQSFTMPKAKESSFTIQRKEYDFFGNNPFLSFSNIKGIRSDAKGAVILSNNEKLLEMKDSHAQILMDWNGEAADFSISTDASQMQFFKIEKCLKGKLVGLDTLNTSIRSELEMQAALGPQDQKISVSFHVNDFKTYMDDIKSIMEKGLNKDNIQDFEKLVPEGILLDIKDYSAENKVYQTSMRGSFGRSKNYFPIKISGEFKVTDKWSDYWQTYYKSTLSNLVDAKIPDELISILKNEQTAKVTMPQLQSFGKMEFTVNLDVPTTLSLTEGKVSFQFKSDPYDLGVVGALINESGSIKLRTRNAAALMTDLESYIARASQPFSQMDLFEIQSIKGYVKGSRVVLDKILEPSGVSEQSVDIQINKEGIKVGKYDLMQVMTLFGEAMGSLVPQPDQVILK